MERYIAIDSGKFATKVAEYNPATQQVRKMAFRTRIGEGDMRDDAIENNTYIVAIDEKVFKVGNGAKGVDAELKTDKTSVEHRISTLTAIARLCSENEIDLINVAVGLPAREWASVPKRENYKEFLFPESVKEFCITIKVSSDATPVTKKFRIKRKFCFPESLGALFCDDSPKVNVNSIVGVLDIGNLNLNATVWQGTELQQDISITEELGGSILVQELSQELSVEFGRCDERYVAQVLLQKPEDRYLRPNNGDQKIMDRSKEVIKKHLLEHTRRIKRCCDGRKWSLDYMDLIVIGGTSRILKEELQEIFGKNIHILNYPNYCNVFGYLRMLCSKAPEIGITIPLDFK